MQKKADMKMKNSKHLDGFLGILLDSGAMLATDADDVLEMFNMILIGFSVQLGQHQDQVNVSECRPHVRRHYYFCIACPHSRAYLGGLAPGPI